MLAAGGTENAPNVYLFGDAGVFAVGGFGGAEIFTVRLYSTPSGC